MPWRHMGEWRYSSISLDLGNRRRWVVSFTPRPRCPLGKIPRYLLGRRLDGPQSRSGRCGVEKISRPYRESNSGRPAGGPSLYRLRYPGSERSIKWRGMLVTLYLATEDVSKQNALGNAVSSWWQLWEEGWQLFRKWGANGLILRYVKPVFIHYIYFVGKLN
jgi:hypothetical protein